MYKYKKLPDQIIEKLYLGDMDHANNIDGLLKLKISHILCSAIHLPLNSYVFSMYLLWMY